MIRQLILTAIAIGLCGGSTVAGAATPYYLVENFTALRAKSREATLAPNAAAPKVGLASGKLEFAFAAKAGSATLQLPERGRPIPAAGVFKLWVLGDQSGNELELLLRQAELKAEPDGTQSLQGLQEFGLPRAKIDFAGWQELSFVVPKLREKNVAWWSAIRVHRPKSEGPGKATLSLDDARLYPAAGGPAGTLQADLIGPNPRPFSADISASIDLRSFADRKSKVRVRLTVTDANENPVSDRDFSIDVNSGDASETPLAAAPENLEAFLPPFDVSIDVISADLPEATAKVERKLVMGNSVYLFDDFSHVFGRWFTAGYDDGKPNVPAGEKIRSNLRNWIVWTHAETQRFFALAQTSVAISPVAITDDERAAAPLPPGPTPLGRRAMQVDYAGDGVVYTSSERYLPGRAYGLGVWVRGDGSGSQLSALILDYTEGGDFFEGGWKRIYDGELPIATLDFTGWRYVEVPLPGNGIGVVSPRGSTSAIDFPLELTAFRVETKTPGAAGSVRVGSIYALTQQASAASLSVHLSYDDANLAYAPERNASAVVHNGWRVGQRNVKANWALLDRDDATIARGDAEFALPAGAAKEIAIPLAQHRDAIAKAAGPLRLQLTASDVRDVAASPQKQLILSKPDSVVRVADFEMQRGYIGLQARGVEPPLTAGEPVAAATADAAHGGMRSLAIEWDKSASKRKFVSIDPPLAGIPTEVSMWVQGDGSGALLYPLIGDRRGLSKGATQGQWDLYLPRTVKGPLQNAVRVDWTGWREVRFNLPLIPPTWKNDLPLRAYLPDYPLGLHVAVLADDAKGDAGKILIDDISVRTHLTPDKRVTLSLDRASESNLVAPGAPLSATLDNADAANPRKVRLVGGVYDWRDVAVATIDAVADLTAAERRQVPIARGIPAGVYSVRLALHDGERTTASIAESVIVADLAKELSVASEALLIDPWKLRQPIGDRFTFIDEDWDWVEFFPGNLQVDSIRRRAAEVSKNAADPYILLGYSAYWASGVGQEQVKSGTFVRRQRDIGHAVDIFMVPERTEDWEAYVRDVMRGAGKDVGGFVVWNSPDAAVPMGVKPEKFAAMLAAADKWRRVYCPKTPLLIGGMARATAIPYLTELAKHGGLEHITGVNVRLDVGRLSPDDAEIDAYAKQLKEVVGSVDGVPRTVLLTDLDWAVEKDAAGLNGFDQAAYLSRAMLLLKQHGLTPAFSIRNENDSAFGLGLTYRRELAAPPMADKVRTMQLRPAWVAAARARQWLERLEPAGEVAIRDVVAGRTRCLLYKRKDDGRAVAIVWRNDAAGELTFASTGLAVESATDLLGGNVPGNAGSFPVGRLPTVFVLKTSIDPAATESMQLLGVRDGKEPAWPQRPLATWSPAAPSAAATGVEYQAKGGTTAQATTRAVDGAEVGGAILQFAAEGSESFKVKVPAGSELVLRKQYILDDKGHAAEVQVNGQSLGSWDLLRSDPKLTGGMREAIFVIPRSAIKDDVANVLIKYAQAGNAVRWDVLAYAGGDFPLSAVGPIHADQNVGRMRFARNAIGSPLKVGTESATNGLGVFARSLVEYSTNAQFKRFTAKVGIDAATEGRGSVTFEIYGDGKKLWSTPVVSGLDAPRAVDLDITGVRRLRLVVGDGGDGNTLDAADWCEPVLHR